MKKVGKAKPKLTDAERHRRLVDMAREVGANESPDAFDRAFKRVVRVTKPLSKRGTSRKQP